MNNMKLRLNEYSDLFKAEFEDNFDVIKLFYNLCNEYDDCEDIVSKLRSLTSEKIITNESYNFIIKNWDKLLYIGDFTNE